MCEGRLNTPVDSSANAESSGTNSDGGRAGGDKEIGNHELGNENFLIPENHATCEDLMTLHRLAGWF